MYPYLNRIIVHGSVYPVIFFFLLIMVDRLLFLLTDAVRAKRS